MWIFRPIFHLFNPPYLVHHSHWVFRHQLTLLCFIIQQNVHRLIHRSYVTIGRQIFLDLKIELQHRRDNESHHHGNAHPTQHESKSANSSLPLALLILLPGDPFGRQIASEDVCGDGESLVGARRGVGVRASSDGRV